MIFEEPIYLEDQQAVMTVVEPDSPKDTTRTIKTQKGQPKEYWMWGNDNLLPNEIIEALEKNVLLPRVIDFKGSILQAGGLVYGPVKTVNGQEVIEPQKINAVEEWLEMAAIDRYIEEATQDLHTFGNIFPEILTNVRGEIVGIQELDASECRLEKQQLKGRHKGKIQNIYVSSNWDEGVQEDLQIVPALDPMFNLVGQLQGGNKHKYAIPIRKLSRGNKYYERSPLENLINSGWLDVANSIPKWKKAVMENQLSIKYHIQINIKYLEHRFSDYKTCDDNQKKKYHKQIGKEFMDVMRGNENAGNAVVSTFELQPGGQEQVGWKIEPIKNERFGDKEYIEDATASDIHIIYSQGVDPTLMGIAARDGMTAGSGSDKRMALNQLILMMRPDQRKILSPLNLKASAEGWHGHKDYAPGTRFAFQFRNYHVATLDNVSAEPNNPTT